jgi:predicted dehydrogenase
VTTAIASTAWWRSQGYYDSAEWRGSKQFDGGGALMNQSVHLVDLLLSFLGRPREVFGFTSLAAHDRIDVEDCAAATITFESGAIATLHATTAAYPGLTTRIQLMGSRGSAIIEDDELTYFHSAESSNAEVGMMGLSFPAGNDVDSVLPRRNEAVVKPAQYQLDPTSHRAQYVDVLQAISEGREPTVTLEDAFHALALIKAVYVAEALRRPVAFDDVVAGTYDHVD